MVCLDEGFGAIIWGGAGIWGEDFSIIQFGYTKKEIPNFHKGFIAEICNLQILA
jgi:hypothetical protein